MKRVILVGFVLFSCACSNTQKVEPGDASSDTADTADGSDPQDDSTALELLWTFQTRGRVDSSPVICDGKVIVGSDDGRLYVVRLTDGTELWSYQIGEAIVSCPAVVDGTIFVGATDGRLYAFSADS